MADSLVNRTLATTLPLFLSDYVDALAKKAVEFYWAKQHDIFTYNQGGRKIEKRIRLTRGSPKGYTGQFENFSHTVVNPWQIAEIEWRGMADSLVVTQKDKWENKGKEAIIKTLPALMTCMKDDNIDEFCTSFHSDGTRLSSLTFHGLAASIGSSAQTWANISQTTYTNWDCQRISGTGFTTNPQRFLHQAILAASVGVKGGKTRNMLDLILTDSTQYLNIEQALDAKVQYTRDLKMAEAGFANIELYGVPVAWSEYAPTLTVRGINSNLFEFFVGGDDVFQSGVATTPPWPILDVGYIIGHFNMFNMNPRGSFIIHTIT